MTCEQCEGRGFVIVEHDGREFAQPCACRRGGVAKDGDSLLLACRVPPRYEHCTLGNFDPMTPQHRTALERAMYFCTGYPHLGAEEGLGLLFTGNNGVARPTSRWPPFASWPRPRMSGDSSGTSTS